jgi:hypothetical protein
MWSFKATVLRRRVGVKEILRLSLDSAAGMQGAAALNGWDTRQ